MWSRIAALLIVLLLAAVPAHAAWFEATSPHFVIDADTSKARIRDFATRLERFDAALRKVYGVADDPTRPRVRVFATGAGTILSLCHGCPAGTAGFYNAGVGGSVILTAALAGGGGLAGAKNLALDPQEVLLHEYSHHFMFANFANGFPMWFAEGFADFNANVLFEPDGDILIGLPANYRAWGLRGNVRLPAATLFAPTRADLADPQRHELIYGRGWLLVHYMMLDKDRRHQFAAYQDAIRAGRPSLAAGQAAFGDLGRLDAALDRYRDGKLAMPLFVAAAPVPAIAVLPLSAGAAAMMPVHFRSVAGVDAKTAARLLPEARRRAAPFPTDPRVQIELAEAEFDAGQDDAADAAADRALAVAPADVTALLYKGRVAGRRLAQAGSHDPAAWAKARGWLVRANRADTENALPLLFYYQTYLAQGVAPPAIAVDGLEKAHRLSPEDGGLRWLLARRRLADGDAAGARTLLEPIAHAPHPRGDENVAQRIIDLIAAGDARAAAAAFPGEDAAPAG